MPYSSLAALCYDVVRRRLTRLAIRQTNYVRTRPGPLVLSTDGVGTLQESATRKTALNRTFQW